MTVDQEPPRGLIGGHPESGRGWGRQAAGCWKVLVGASVTRENGQHAREGRVTEPQVSAGHRGPGKPEAQEELLWRRDAMYSILGAKQP